MAKSRTSILGRDGIALPDMAPFAGLIVVLIGFYMLTGQFKQTGYGAETGIVALEQLPAIPFSCFKPLDPNGTGTCVISLNPKNELSFALPETEHDFQSAVIARVASQHGVRLSPSQLAQVHSMRFLNIDINRLTALLAVPRWERQKQLNSGKFGHLSPTQLAECVAATQYLALRILGHPVYYSLKVHADEKSPQFYGLTDILQSQGINRYNLLTQARE